MNYEYTGNCTLEEKVNIVSKEIMEAYPEITLKDARYIAMLDNKVTKEADGHIKFRRLYNILLITFSNTIIFNKVLKDMISAYNSIKDKTISETNLFEDIILFYKGELETFPIISNY